MSTDRLSELAGPTAVAEMRTLVRVLTGDDKASPRRVLITAPPSRKRSDIAQAAASEAGVEYISLRWGVNFCRTFRDARKQPGTVMMVVQYDDCCRADLVAECRASSNDNLVIVVLAEKPEDLRDDRLQELFTWRVALG